MEKNNSNIEAAISDLQALIDSGKPPLDNSTIIDKGTEAGGSIEVYLTAEDANKRNEYLAGFDGVNMFNSGSHSVVGTVVIRTSAKLTASQQNEMEKNIYNSLIEIR